MRFPFRFMGLLSVLLAVWIGSYVYLHPVKDGLTLALELLPAVALAGFGVWVLMPRRLRQP
jgi:cytochrome c-type biogenesis protein CcmH/NrfF